MDLVSYVAIHEIIFDKYEVIEGHEKSFSENVKNTKPFRAFLLRSYPSLFTVLSLSYFTIHLYHVLRPESILFYDSALLYFTVLLRILLYHSSLLCVTVVLRILLQIHLYYVLRP